MAEYFFNDLRHKVLQSAMRKLEDLPQVTIAAINGPAVGVGLEMATLCDMRIASDRARFGEVAVPAGFVPESGGARNLPKLIGIGRAMRLILTGEIIDAKEALAHRAGRRSRAGRPSFSTPRSLSPARIAANPYLSVRQAKRLVKMYWNWNRTDEGYQQELDAVLEITRTKDCQEGMRAFVEKRSPRYTYPYDGGSPFPKKSPQEDEKIVSNDCFGESRTRLSSGAGKIKSSSTMCSTASIARGCGREGGARRRLRSRHLRSIAATRQRRGRRFARSWFDTRRSRSHQDEQLAGIRRRVSRRGEARRDSGAGQFSAYRRSS